MGERWTDERIMELAWESPRCPVLLSGQDAEHPWGPSIPFRRERIEIPRQPHLGADLTWRHLCRCHGTGYISIDAATVKLIRPSVVDLRGQLWGETRPGGWAVTVYLGQCPDCGTIYWGIVDE